MIHPTENTSIHPFFRSHIPHTSSNGPHIALRAASSAPATQLRLETPPLDGIATNQKATSGKLNSVNTFLTSNDSVPDTQINQFPIYSYKHYKPLPTVVYTQHEEEANDLIAGLKPGYVFFNEHVSQFFFLVCLLDD